METKQIITIALIVAVGATVISGVMIPAISMATETETTFTNEGYFRMSQYDNTSTHVVNWTYEKPTVVTVDGVDVTINYNVPNGQITVVANSIWLFRMYFDSNGEVSAVAFLYESSGTKSAQVSNEETASLTLTSGSASVVCGTYSGTHSYEVVYLPDNNGEYVMCNPNNTNYINADSPIYGFGLTRVKNSTGTVGSPGVGFAFSGDYENGIVGSVWRGSESNIVTDSEIVVTKNTSYTDLYKFDRITAISTLTETVDDQTVTTNTDLVYNIVILPYEVTAELSVHADAPTRAIFEMLPVIAVLGLLIGIVAIGYMKFRS